MRTALYILLLAVGLFLTPVSAETLTIPGHRPVNAKQIMPRRGIDMEAVLEDFGEPIQRVEPIGDPPITQWVYSEYKVYFEFETVLHTIDMTTLILPIE